MKRRNETGFTLIEAAVAIAVVAILSGIIVPLVVKNLRDSQISRAKNDVQVIAAAIASQLKDTGTRPRLAGGFGGATGAANAQWASGPTGVVGVPGFAAIGNQTFTDLFTANSQIVAQNTLANAMFGTIASSEFSYRGPYMGADVAVKTDPWGSPYYIIGYNANSQGINGPIWVVCAGPDKAVLAANLAYNVAAGGYPSTWNQTVGTTSADDIVVRVN